MKKSKNRSHKEDHKRGGGDGRRTGLDGRMEEHWSLIQYMCFYQGFFSTVHLSTENPS